MDFSEERRRMVELQLARRGISDRRVLEAFGVVPREAFLPEDLVEFAYNDSPLPIGESQTISQPYIVAATVAALELKGNERVLEIGTGSGYAAAILSRVAKEVFTVERLPSLAERAEVHLNDLGYRNVHVLCRDGTLGWPEHAPYDAIAVAAGGPEVPKALLAQLAPGGRMLIPVGPDETSQALMLIAKDAEGLVHEQAIEQVRFVPLIGEQGWPESRKPRREPSTPSPRPEVASLVRETAERFDDLSSINIDGLIDRIGSARIVLLGESTHGSSEFYRMRNLITRRLIERAGFDFVAAEADWPDAARIDEYVFGDERRSRLEFTPFSRFPTWMWRNEEVHEFVHWLREHNLDQRDPDRRAGFHGLDLYSLFTSIAAVLAYLDEVDPKAAVVARRRYGTLTPWQKDPAAYGEAVLVGRYRSSEDAVVAMLRDMLERRLEYVERDGERFFDATQNARVVANAERYYRAMYYGSITSWNLRDSHMFETLQALLSFYGPMSRGVVWAHNSHVGNALATELSLRGELNIGQLCRTKFGDDAYIVGFGTDHGTVAAASDWGRPMERMSIRPGHPESYEHIFHRSNVEAFLLPLRYPKRAAVREELYPARLERAIGVVYRPQTELMSHYFQASLARQFDEYVWFDETSAVEPLQTQPRENSHLPETYPFGG